MTTEKQRLEAALRSADAANTLLQEAQDQLAVWKRVALEQSAMMDRSFRCPTCGGPLRYLGITIRYCRYCDVLLTQDKTHQWHFNPSLTEPR
jgi:uncharacterized protein with PIN domain